MRFGEAIDLYVQDMRAQGRLNSDASERGYRAALDAHADDVGNFDPAFSDRNDVKKTLRRWANANTQRKCRSVLISFYDWCMEEGYRPDNPARQTRRPKRKPTQVYRLTRDEAAAMLKAARGTRERRAIHLGICAGLRNAELRGLRGIHFSRPGFVHVSADIAKGGRERWVPVIAELAPIADEICETVGPDEYVLPAQRWRDGFAKAEKMDLRLQASSSQALRTLVMGVAKRAGIQAHVHPHLMRHAFGDHVARFAGIKNAQYVLGHATVGTTETYVGQPTLDELVAALSGLGFGQGTDVRRGSDEIWLKARTGIEPVPTASEALEPNQADDPHHATLLDRLAGMAPTLEIYADHFGAKA